MGCQIESSMNENAFLRIIIVVCMADERGLKKLVAMLSLVSTPRSCAGATHHRTTSAIPSSGPGARLMLGKRGEQAVTTRGQKQNREVRHNLGKTT